MSLGNGAIFTLVKLENSDEMMDFLNMLCFTYFFFKEERQRDIQLHDQF